MAFSLNRSNILTQHVAKEVLTLLRGKAAHRNTRHVTQAWLEHQDNSHGYSIPSDIDIDERPDPELFEGVATGPVTDPAMDEPRKDELLDVMPGDIKVQC